MFGFLKNKLKEWVSGAKEKIKPEEKQEIIEEKPKEKKPIKKEKPSKTSKEKSIKQDKKQKEPSLKKEIKQKPTKEKIVSVEDEEVLATVNENKEISKITSEIEKGEISPKQAIQELNELREESENVILEKEKKQGFFKKLFGKKEEKPIEEIETEEISEENEEVKEDTDQVIEQPKEKTSFLQRVRQTFIYKITEEDFNSLFDDLEMLLLENNVAMEVTDEIKSILSKKLIGKEIKKEDLEKEIRTELKETLNELLVEPDDPTDTMKAKKPFVILFFGINGTGKTTSIAKLAHLIKSKGLSVALAAADTFRAASIEQISEHARRLEVPLIKHDYGSDPAAVGFDAIKYAKTHGIDVVLIDTAGRMHTKTNLMSEMEKIVRVTNPDLKIFVAESIAGNDATEQAKTFHESIKIDGAILSKADIDEKGGTIISISAITKKPIFYLGTGQNYEDLKLFNKQEFIKSLGLD